MATARAPSRTASQVRKTTTRPTNPEDKNIVQSVIDDWPVSPSRRRTVKRILNVDDCRLGIGEDGELLVEAPGDCRVVCIDVSVEGPRWCRVLL